MSNLAETILSNFKIFSRKTNDEPVFSPGQNKPDQKSGLFALAIIGLIVGWVVYKYRAMIQPYFQPMIDQIRLHAHLTPTGEIATTQAPPDAITLDSLAKLLGIATETTATSTSTSQ